jgi:hypothetical protein
VEVISKLREKAARLVTERAARWRMWRRRCRRTVLDRWVAPGSIRPRFFGAEIDGVLPVASGVAAIVIGGAPDRLGGRRGGVFPVNESIKF